jgi:hypothetical protein
MSRDRRPVPTSRHEQLAAAVDSPVRRLLMEPTPLVRRLWDLCGFDPTLIVSPT